MELPRALRVEPRSLGITACVVGGFLLSNMAYRLLILPRLPGWDSIPPAWYPVLVVPPIVGVLAAGLLARSWRQILQAATLSTVLNLASFFFGFGGGGHEYGAVEALVYGPPTAFLLVGIPVGLIYACKTRLRPPPNAR